MKIKMSRRELNECLTNVFNRIINEGKDRRSNDFEKVTKKSNREIEKDNFGDGFKSYDKIHKSSKDYSRKGKNKKNYMNSEYDLNENIVDTDVNPIYPNEKNNDMSNWSEGSKFVDYVTIKTDIDPGLLVTVYEQNEGDAVLINTNYALDGGLNPMNDSIAMEGSESPYVNIIAVKSGNENSEAIQILVDVLHSEEIQNFIIETYKGAVVPVSE